jgi:predicted transcriptional regulator
MNVINTSEACKGSVICQDGLDSISSLCQISAQDVMTRDVLCVYGSWSVKELVNFFMHHSISGAPVLNEDNHLSGVVSATDVLEFGNISRKEKIEIARKTYYQEFIGQQLTESDLEQLSQHTQENYTIDNITTPEVLSAQPDAPLPSVANMMAEKHIHRIFVVENKKVIGVISTMDLLKAIGSLCD